MNEEKPAQRELSVESVLQAAIEQKLQAEGGRFLSRTYLEIGILGGLLKAHRYDHSGLQGKA